ncbi:hypothetical protein [Microbacterium arborescens]|uniref:hypothetical protein n=1 Tax=Microbacterium arborescens TaxID=33883 RepID=UPI003C751E81
MTRLSTRQWLAIATGAIAFFAGAVVMGFMSALDSLGPTTGWIVTVASISGLVLMIGTVVHALLSGDTEGVERQDAARASMITVLVVVVAGFAYSLLEAFTGMPRLTAAVPAAVAGLTWMVSFAWGRWGGEEG